MRAFEIQCFSVPRSGILQPIEGQYASTELCEFDEKTERQR